MSPTSSLRSLCVLPLASGPYHCLCNGNSSFLPRRLPSSVLQPPSTSQGKYAHVLVVSSSCHLIPRTMLLCSISSSSSGGQGTRRWGLPLPMGALVSQGGMGLGAMASLHLDAFRLSRFRYSALNQLLFRGGGLPTCLP